MTGSTHWSSYWIVEALKYLGQRQGGRPGMITAWRMRTELGMEISAKDICVPSTEISTRREKKDICIYRSKNS